MDVSCQTSNTPLKPYLRYDGDNVCDMEDDYIAVWAVQYPMLDRWKGNEKNKTRHKSK